MTLQLPGGSPCTGPAQPVGGLASYLAGQEIRRIGLHNDPLKRDLSQRVPGSPGRAIGEHGREAHGQVGEVTQQRLDDRVAAREAVPAGYKRSDTPEQSRP